MDRINTIKRTTKVSCPVRYEGNIIFLILFLILWFPVGILLFLKNGSMIAKSSRFYINYHGGWRWLLFWGVFFFPIAILLMIIKGVDVIEEETILEEET